MDCCMESGSVYETRICAAKMTYNYNDNGDSGDRHNSNKLRDVRGVDIASETCRESDHAKDTFPSWHNAVAGGCAGAGSRVATAPLDLVRIRRQLTPVDRYPAESIVQSWKAIVQNEGGLAALFRGNTAAFYLWIGYAAVQFQCYQACQKAFGDVDYLHQSSKAFISGASAGVCAMLTTYPFDVCRTTFAARGIESSQTSEQTVRIVVDKEKVKQAAESMQQGQHQRRPLPFSSLVEPSFDDRHMTRSSQQLVHKTTKTHIVSNVAHTKPPTSLWEFVQQLYRLKGIKGFYAGAGPATLQIIPYMGINFAIYDHLTSDDKRVIGSAYAGSVSGAVSKLLVYPLDTIKRRIQAHAFYEGSYQSPQQMTSMVKVVKHIIQNESVASFYRGVVPSVLKTTVATGLSFAIFRGTKNALEAAHWK